MPDLPTGTVTFLFTDIEGSTRLWEQQPDAMRRALVRHDAIIEQGVAGHGGLVVRPRGEGDSRFAVFARASDAVAAAVAIQRALHAEPWPTATPLQVRMALHTGEADLRAGDYYGAAVNRCARLRAVAYGGQVLLSQASFDLVQEALPPDTSLRDLGEQRLRDLRHAEHVYQLLHPDLPAAFPPLTSLGDYRDHLPVQLTSFIGRQQEVTEVVRALERWRLLTLTGPGGTGKTRLALEAARRLLGSYPDGAWFVPLAPLADPALVAEAVAHALDVKEVASTSLMSSLTSFLRSKRLLLVLDNCEHLLEAVPLVDELLAIAPGLTVLATSRSPLRLAGEHEFAVSPLRLPGDGAVRDVVSLAQYDAVQLFIERARAVKGDFQVTNANAPAVAELCHRLDGLPLAIELAAARVRLLSPQALLVRLAGHTAPLQVLSTGPRDMPRRQQTLRNTIAWSYDLLNLEEQRLFARIGVFAGGATLAAIEAVTNADGQFELEVFEGMDALVTNSLVRAEGTASVTPRFGMLVTVRDFARERLVAEGSWEELRHRHADYYLTLAERLAPSLTSPQRWDALRELDAEQDNLRVVLEWTLTVAPSAEPAARLAASLAWYWYWRSRFSEGRRWLGAVLEQGMPTPRTLPWAMAHFGAGALAWLHGDPAAGRPHVEESISVLRELGAQRALGHALTVLAGIVLQLRDPQEGLRLCREGLEVTRVAGDSWWEGTALAILGDAALITGDLVSAQAAYEHGLALYEQNGDTWGRGLLSKALASVTAWQGDYQNARDVYVRSVIALRETGPMHTMAAALIGLGDAALRLGELSLATASFKESLGHYQEFGVKAGIAMGLVGLGETALARGDYERAARLLAAAPGHFGVGGVVIIRPVPEREVEARVAAVRARMGDAAFTVAWTEGQAMTLEQAAAYALEEDGGA